ncbi:hypothetical protein Tcan_11718 [Toxocara canis]|uniref:Uncharacterized protein n=1 Tax=Toxocara canis TaxID=6265 RepID=A0A0B2UW45_TOXCA|nr:hypothetical protein Tcan_11718 [Toxocara canis]
MSNDNEKFDSAVISSEVCFGPASLNLRVEIGILVDMENSSNVPRAIMASFVILTVPFSLCLYIVVMKQLYCNRTFRKKSAYRMMIVIGLFDCIQLSVHLCLAILEVIYLFGHLDDSAYENSVHNKILGAFLNGAWFPMTIIKLLLAFDQFLAIVFPTVEDVLFTATNVRITVILLWSCFVAMTVLHLTPYATFKYNPKMLLWSYDGRSALGFVLEYIDRAFSSTVVVSSLLFYLTITVNTLQTAQRTFKWNSCEGKLALQVLILNGYQVFVVVYWNTTTLLDYDTDIIQNMISSLLWVIWNFINPFIYISFNKVLRNDAVACYRHIFLSFQPSHSK